MSKFDLTHLFKDKQEIKISDDKIYQINTSIKTFMKYKNDAQELQEKLDNGTKTDELEALELIIKNGLGENNWNVIKELPNLSLEILQEMCYAIMSAWTGRPINQMKDFANKQIDKELETEKK